MEIGEVRESSASGQLLRTVCLGQRDGCYFNLEAAGLQACDSSGEIGATVAIFYIDIRGSRAFLWADGYVHVIGKQEPPEKSRQIQW